MDDDDVAVTLSGVTSSVTEGDQLVFKVALDKPASTDVSVTLFLEDGTASAGADYANLTGTAALALTFRAVLLETELLVTIPTMPDGLTEGSETFNVKFATEVTFDSEWGQSGSVDVSDQVVVGTIFDEDEAFLTISDATASEGGDLVFVLTNSAPTDVSFVVTCVLEAGSATAVDYSALTLEVPFDALASSSTLTVSALVDDLAEGPETFVVRIVNTTLPASHALSIPEPTAVGSIVDVDMQVSASIASDTRQEGDNFDFVVSLNVPAVVDITVSYLLSPLTASASDYSPNGVNTVVVNAGQTQASVVVEAVTDGLVEQIGRSHV